MRFILGLIVGVALTVGGAYLHDTSAGPGPLPPAPIPDTAAPPLPERANIVNWDVVGAIVREQTAFIKGIWDRAVGG